MRPSSGAVLRNGAVCPSVCPVRHVGPIISKQKVLETSSLQILLQILSHARIYWYGHYRADQIKVTRSGKIFESMPNYLGRSLDTVCC